MGHGRRERTVVVDEGGARRLLERLRSRRFWCWATSTTPQATRRGCAWFPTFRAGAADDLARVLRQHLALEPQVSAELAREAARWVRTRFDWDLIAEQY